MGKSDGRDTQKQTIVELQNRIRAWERGSSPSGAVVQSTSCDALDALFPDRGVLLGSLVEWLGDGEASGAGALSLIAARHVCATGRRFVLIDTRHHLFPLALAVVGFDLSTLVMIRPDSEREALWACEEALRCQAVGLVWANIERLGGTSFRRLQLAAEESAGVGFLLRSAKAMRQSSWADVRLLVQPRPSHEASPCFRVEVVYSRGRPLRSTADVQIDSFRGTIHEVSSANPANSLPVVS